MNPTFKVADAVGIQPPSSPPPARPPTPPGSPQPSTSSEIFPELAQRFSPQDYGSQAMEDLAPSTTDDDDEDDDFEGDVNYPLSKKRKMANCIPHLVFLKTHYPGGISHFIDVVKEQQQKLDVEGCLGVVAIPDLSVEFPPAPPTREPTVQSLKTMLKRKLTKTIKPRAPQKMRYPELLLPRSYKLYDKEIYYGYYNLEPVFCFISDKRASTPLMLTSMEFSTFMNSPFTTFYDKEQQDLQSSSHFTLPKRLILDNNPNLRVRISTKHGEEVLILEEINDKNSKITFTIQELKKLRQLKPIITTHGIHMEFNKQVIAQFFNDYVESCRALNVRELSVRDYKHPVNFVSSKIDFFQLHVEIGEFMRDDVLKKIVMGDEMEAEIGSSYVIAEEAINSNDSSPTYDCLCL